MWGPFDVVCTIWQSVCLCAMTSGQLLAYYRTITLSLINESPLVW